jgi:hypothetical protein
LASYAGNCGACMDLLYTALSNEVLEELRWHGPG